MFLSHWFTLKLQICYLGLLKRKVASEQNDLSSVRSSPKFICMIGDASGAPFLMMKSTGLTNELLHNDLTSHIYGIEHTFAIIQTRRIGNYQGLKLSQRHCGTWTTIHVPWEDGYMVMACMDTASQAIFSTFHFGQFIQLAGAWWRGGQPKINRLVRLPFLFKGGMAHLGLIHIF